MDPDAVEAAFLGETLEHLDLSQRPRAGSFVDLLTEGTQQGQVQSYEELAESRSGESAYLHYLMSSDEVWTYTDGSPMLPSPTTVYEATQSEPSSPLKTGGALTHDERHLKIMKYQQKRTRRTWRKRVNYSRRKKVAESRFRIKGRFVTREQAMLSLVRISEPEQ